MQPECAENFYSILKRGIIGTYHSISETCPHRYPKERDLHYNNRSGLGVEDAERAAKALRGIEGNRLILDEPLDSYDA